MVTPSILDTASPNAREISDLFWLVLGFSVFVMAVVVLFVVAGIIGGIRDRELDKEPPQTHGNLKLEIAWTVIPLIILAILLIPTLDAIYRLDGFAAPDSRPSKSTSSVSSSGERWPMLRRESLPLTSWWCR